MRMIITDQVLFRRVQRVQLHLVYAIYVVREDRRRSLVLLHLQPVLRVRLQRHQLVHLRLRQHICTFFNRF